MDNEYIRLALACVDDSLLSSDKIKDLAASCTKAIQDAGATPIEAITTTALMLEAMGHAAWQIVGCEADRGG